MPDRPPQTARGFHAPVRFAAPPHAGEQRHRQRQHGRFPRRRLRSVLFLPGSEQGHQTGRSGDAQRSSQGTPGSPRHPSQESRGGDAGDGEGGVQLRPGPVLSKGLRPRFLRARPQRLRPDAGEGLPARQICRHTFGQGLLLARRLIEAGTRFVQVNWPAVANGDPNVDAFDTHAANFGPLRNLQCPKLDSGLSALLEDMDQRGLLNDTLVIAIGEFGRSPRLGVSTSGNGNAPDGRDHWPYCYTALTAGAGVRRGALYGKSDATGSSPAENPVHPVQILATVYHALGIDPRTIVLNHLNQPRELVDARFGEPVAG